jgi:hypothetical protein
MRRWLQAGYCLAALIGGVYGWGVGVQIAGLLMGTVMAINAAVFGALLVGGAANLVLYLQRRHRRGK